MSKFDKIFNKLIPFLFNGIIFIYLFGGIFAPIAKHFELNKISDFLYWIYHFFCHQKPKRSLFILGEQMAFCSRDFGIFLAMQIVGILSLFPQIKVQKLPILTILILITPMILDGSIQLFAEILSKLNNNDPFYTSTNTIRLITGILFGSAMGNYLFGTIREEFKIND